MKKFIIIVLITSGIAFTSCHSNNKSPNRQNDTSAAKGSGGPADSTKTATSGNSAATPNSSDTTALGADTDSAVHPVH
jgi:hypothetical protein